MNEQEYYILASEVHNGDRFMYAGTLYQVIDGTLEYYGTQAGIIGIYVRDEDSGELLTLRFQSRASMVVRRLVSLPEIRRQLQEMRADLEAA